MTKNESANSGFNVNDNYCALRDQVLMLDPEQLGLHKDKPFAVLMETGAPEGVATLVAIADGTTSLYLSSGGGVIGAGIDPIVRILSADLLSSLSDLANHLESTQRFPLPGPKRVRFYLLSVLDGARTIEAPIIELAEHRHPLAPIFHLAQDLVTAVMTHSDETQAALRSRGRP